MKDELGEANTLLLRVWGSVKRGPHGQPGCQRLRKEGGQGRASWLLGSSLAAASVPSPSPDGSLCKGLLAAGGRERGAEHIDGRRTLRQNKPLRKSGSKWRPEPGAGVGSQSL